jgi:hypothetical protein
MPSVLTIKRSESYAADEPINVQVDATMGAVGANFEAK